MLDFLVLTASQLKEAANTTRFYWNHLKPAERPIVRQILEYLKCMAVKGDDHLEYLAKLPRHSQTTLNHIKDFLERLGYRVNACRFVNNPSFDRNCVVIDVTVPGMPSGSAGTKSKERRAK